MQVDLYTKDGQISGKVELPDDVFAIDPNENAMHQSVVIYLAHQRQGTRKTKTRAEVRGGGKKPWRQKGRGTARSGSSRSPVWVGGGTVHGPKPGVREIKITKKLNRLARKSALSLRVQENNIIVVDDFAFNEIKTKNFFSVMKNLKIDTEKTLALIPEHNEIMYMSARNIPNLSLHPADKISTYHILAHKKLLIFKSSIDKIVNTFNN
jgi:large subunit ribosomal protein L4